MQNQDTMLAGSHLKRGRWPMTPVRVGMTVIMFAAYQFGCASGETVADESDTAPDMAISINQQPTQPPQSDTAFTTTALDAGLSPPMSSSNSMGQAEQCEPFSRLGPCSFCGDDGAPFMPMVDGTCPAIECQGPITYRTVEEENSIRCISLGPPLDGNQKCVTLGECPTEATGCEPEEQTVGNPIESGGCQTLEGCEGANPPEQRPVAVGVSCRSGEKPAIQYVRLVTRESDSTSSWKEVSVIGQLAGGEPRNIIDDGNARVEVSSGSELANRLIDDDESTSWSPETQIATVTINLGAVYEVGRMNFLVGTGHGPNTVHELLIAGADKSYRLVRVYRGPFGENQWLRFGGVGYCDANQVCQSAPDCRPFLFEGRGQICDFGGDGQNTYCEIFVDRNVANADQQKTCNDICGANSRCVGAYANHPIYKCRPALDSDQDCDEPMKDFICRCALL